MQFLVNAREKTTFIEERASIDAEIGDLRFVLELIWKICCLSDFK